MTPKDFQIFLNAQQKTLRHHNTVLQRHSHQRIQSEIFGAFIASLSLIMSGATFLIIVWRMHPSFFMTILAVSSGVALVAVAIWAAKRRIRNVRGRHESTSDDD